MKKMLRQLLSLLLAMSMMIVAVPMDTVEAVAAELHEQVDGVEYTIDADGTITGAVLNGAVEISIPEIIDGIPVTAIGYGVFASNRSLVSVKIPEGVTTIYDNAFQNCTSLSKVELPDSLTHIGNHGFLGCTSLTSLELSEQLESIGNYVFADCSRLESITFAENLTSIGEGAFHNCRTLTQITIPEGVPAILTNTFYGCNSLSSVSLPDSLESIGTSAFLECRSLRELTLPAQLYSIGDNAFKLTSLESLVIPEGTVSIGDFAFLNCADLQYIQLPNTLENIGYCAFKMCTSLATLEFAGDHYSEGLIIQADAFDACSSLTSMELPEHTVSLGEGAFFACSRLESVTLPSGLTVIEPRTFSSCSSMKFFEIPDGITAIGDQAFRWCSQLSGVVIPNSVETIGAYAFEHCEIITVTIPASVMSLGTNAFYTNISMKEATILGRDTAIGDNCFDWANDNQGFYLYGYSNSTAQQYAEESQARGQNVIFMPMDLLRQLSVTVQDPEGNPITDGFSVHWMNDQGTEVGWEPVLPNADSTRSYALVIELGEELAAVYSQPEVVVIDSEMEGHVVITLERLPMRTTTLSGWVVNKDRQPLAGADITVEANGERYWTITQEDGSFAVEGIPCVPNAILSIQCEGYYSVSHSLNLSEVYDSAHEIGEYVMIRMVSDRLNLTVSLRDAVAEGGEERERKVSLNQLHIAVKDEHEKEITGFEIQEGALVFYPDTVYGGQTLIVEVWHPGNQYVPSVVTVTLDQDRMGSAQVVLTQKGTFALEELSGPTAVVLLFDGNGNYIYTKDAVSNQVYAPLDTGDYDLVLLQKTTLLHSVPNLSVLDTLGLQEGTDYLRMSIGVREGRITVLSGIHIPKLEESRLTYTLAEHTSVTLNKSGTLVQGELFMLRLAYELDPAKGKAASCVEVLLPDGFEPEGNMALVGSRTVVYERDGNRIMIPVTEERAAIYLYGKTGMVAGNYGIAGVLGFTDGTWQSIGTAGVTVEQASLHVPQRTSSTVITVSGKALPDSNVRIYDNGIHIGDASVSATGKWSAEVDLSQAGEVYSYSYHKIHGEVLLPDGGSAVTDRKTVIYDEATVRVKTVTMHNVSSINGVIKEGVTTLDYTTAQTTVPNYVVDIINYPRFSFFVEFEEGGPELAEVSVVTKNASGSETIYVPATYNEELGGWVGYHTYAHDSLVPAQISVAYTVSREDALLTDEALLQDLKNAYEEMEEEVSATILPVAEGLFSVDNTVSEDGTVNTGTLYYNDPDSGQKVMAGTFESVYTERIEETVTEEFLQAQGYQRAMDTLAQEMGAYMGTEGIHAGEHDVQNVWYKVEERAAGGKVTTFVDLTNRCSVESVSFPTAQTRGQMVSIQSEDPSIGMTLTMDLLLSLIATSSGMVLGGLASIPLILAGAPALLIGGVMLTSGLLANLMAQLWDNSNFRKMALDLLDGKCQELYDDMDRLMDKLNEKCEDGTLKLSPDDYAAYAAQLDGLSRQISDFHTAAMNAIDGTRNLAIARALTLGLMGDMQGLSHLSTFLSGTDMGLDNVGISYEAYTQDFISQRGNDLHNTMTRLDWEIQYGAMLANPCDDDPEPKDETDPRDIEGVHDPSGYVYEAVPSNRLAGVEAVVSYIDEAGQPVVWDAERYDQINGQITGEDGAYQWNVPIGLWIVNFTKEGYAATDTMEVARGLGYADGLLPVPPPQLNINVGMVSTQAPQVEYAMAYTDQAILVFTQYMDIDSVKRSVSLFHGGILADYTIEPLNAEYDLEGTTQYSTRFAVIPREGKWHEPVSIYVSYNARNYAGTFMEAQYLELDLIPTLRPEELKAAETVVMGTNGSKKVRIQLDPGTAGHPLHIENLTPGLIETGHSMITTDENGAAIMIVESKMPGTGVVRVTEPLSGMTKTINILVSAETEPAPVTVQLEQGEPVVDGMILAEGSKVSLSTTEEGQIYYTLNDTCPCKEGALLYEGPLTIYKDTVLRAVVLRNGIYGKTIRMELTVTPGGENCPSDQFVDVDPELWYHEAIDYVVRNGLMNGIGNGKFDPSGLTTRSMIVTILWRLEGQPTGEQEVRFEDVMDGEWYTQAIRWAAGEGIVGGYGNGLFGPGDPITREQLATILYRYETYKGGTYDGSFSLEFSDVDEVSTWAYEGLSWCNMKGIVTGKGQGILDPQGKAQRSEAATMLMRYIELDR